jgi:hypothetical protein
MPHYRGIIARDEHQYFGEVRAGLCNYFCNSPRASYAGEPETTATIATPHLHELVERIIPLRELPQEKQRELIGETWRLLGPPERFLWHKLILDEFRVGIARTLVVRAFTNFAPGAGRCYVASPDGSVAADG